MTQPVRATAHGRNDSDIERSSLWEDAGAAEAYRDAGVTLFTTEIHPDTAGYDFGTLETMVAWRDRQRPGRRRSRVRNERGPERAGVEK